VHPKAMPVILHGPAKDASSTGNAAEALALPVADELMRGAEWLPYCTIVSTDCP